MSTQADIIIKDNNIYHHRVLFYDGYLLGVGVLLNNFFTNSNLVDALLQNNNIYTINKTNKHISSILSQTFKDSVKKTIQNIDIIYSDNKQNVEQYQNYKDLAKNLSNEHTYLWNKQYNLWFFNPSTNKKSLNKYIPLEEALLLKQIINIINEHKENQYNTNIPNIHNTELILKFYEKYYQLHKENTLRYEWFNQKLDNSGKEIFQNLMDFSNKIILEKTLSTELQEKTRIKIKI